jgi:LysM repeat protein
MSRTAAVSFVFGLLLVSTSLVAPAPVAAQDPVTAVPATPATHTVQPGETLGSIAEALLGSAAAWRQIHELNRDQVPDPSRMAVGTVLVLPAAAEVSGDARVVTVQVVSTPPGSPGMAAPMPAGAGGDYLERRTLLQRQPFVPREAPEPAESERTIFYGSLDPQVQSDGYTQVLLLPESEIPVVQPAVARAAGWVVADEAALEELGQIRRFATERALGISEAALLVGDDVVVRASPGVALRSGDTFTTVRPPRFVEGFGWLVVPTGEVEVRSVDDGNAVVRVTRAWQSVQLGQFIVDPFVSHVPVGVTPRQASRQLDAEIVAFEDGKELYLAGDRFFINRGTESGISIGDTFMALTEASTAAEGTAGASVVGHFQVVRVQQGAATLRIMQTIEPREIQVGSRVFLVSEMP